MCYVVNNHGGVKREEWMKTVQDVDKEIQWFYQVTAIRCAITTFTERIKIYANRIEFSIHFVHVEAVIDNFI
jgi:hypothetical protein